MKNYEFEYKFNDNVSNTSSKMSKCYQFDLKYEYSYVV